MTGREKETVRHLSEDDLDRLLTQTDSEKVSRLFTFVTQLSRGATLEDAADDVGMSQSTGSRWTKLWNKSGLGLLAPGFGGGRPPKLNERQRKRFLELLEEDEPWKKQEKQHLMHTEFDVEYHPNFLPRLLDDLDLSYAILRIKKPTRPDNAEEILNERVADALAEDETDEPHNKRDEDDSDEEWTVDDAVRTDGDTTVGFVNISHPQPWDNSQRLYTVTEPTITRQLVKIDTPAAGFSALTGEGVLQFIPTQETDLRISRRYANRIRVSGSGFCLSWINSCHTSVHTRKNAPTNSGSTSLPIGSPQLKPIEPVWKSLKWESLPLILIVEGAAEYRALLESVCGKLTDRLSFAGSWIENHLSGLIQKLR